MSHAPKHRPIVRTPSSIAEDKRRAEAAKTDLAKWEAKLLHGRTKPRVELCGMRGGIAEPFIRCADCDEETEHRCSWLEECARAGFAPEDYAFTAKLMRQHTADASPKLFQAVCSNNLNIILAALDAMGDEP